MLYLRACYQHDKKLELGDDLLRGKGLNLRELVVIQLVLISLNISGDRSNEAHLRWSVKLDSLENCQHNIKI
jgi:hypothetical protein